MARGLFAVLITCLIFLTSCGGLASSGQEPIPGPTPTETVIVTPGPSPIPGGAGQPGGGELPTAGPGVTG
jgi:hypothetical protein